MMMVTLVKVVVMVMIMAMVNKESEQTWPPLQHTNSVHHAPTEAPLQQQQYQI